MNFTGLIILLICSSSDDATFEVTTPPEGLVEEEKSEVVSADAALPLSAEETTSKLHAELLRWMVKLFGDE